MEYLGDKYVQSVLVAAGAWAVVKYGIYDQLVEQMPDIPTYTPEVTAAVAAAAYFAYASYGPFGVNVELMSHGSTMLGTTFDEAQNAAKVVASMKGLKNILPPDAF